MLTLNMLGHVYVTQDGTAVQVSHKGAALLSYLALEKQSHHREHLADLLWEHPQSLRNLRVELTRLKQQGISPFVARQPMLSLNCPTDLDLWLQGSDQLTEKEVPDWLARMRGFPLSGLEDVGSAHFRTWVEQQRWSITEALERKLSDVYGRFAQRGQVQVTELIRERAARLGLNLLEPAPPPVAPGNLSFRFWEQEKELRRVAELALGRPQLVYLHGPHGSKRQTVSFALEGTDWRLAQVQDAPNRRFLQAAILQHLAQLLPELQADFLRLISALSDQDEIDLIRASSLLARAKTPVAIAVHVDEAHHWLANALRFMLDLPQPLLLIVCSPSATTLQNTQELIGNVNWNQVHELTLPAVGVQGVLQAMQSQGRTCTFEQAAHWSQRAEGWPLYLHSECSAADTSATRQPRLVTNALMAELRGVPAPTRLALARLAQIHDRFDAALAAQVLGQDPQADLAYGQERGLLVPAAAHERVELPELSIWVDDREPHLKFASESLRVALATELPAPERHRLRCLLAEFYRDRSASLHYYYVQRTGLNEQPSSTPLHLCPESARTAVPAALTLLGEPAAPLLHLPRQELRSPNSYRIALENGTLEVMRKGSLGPTPELTLAFGTLPRGNWQMSVRVDVFRNYTRCNPAPFTLAVGDSGGRRAVYSAELLPAEAPETALPFAQLPLHRWVRLSGFSEGGLELSTRAMDLALSIRDLRWNDTDLLVSRHLA